MQFSTKAEYGLKAMINLANAYPNQKNSKEISEEESISNKYLERLLSVLKKEQLVQSSKGKSGGYTLVRKPNLIKVGEIVEILDGPISPMKCVGSFCAIEHKCPSSAVWNKVAEQVKQTLYKIKLSDLTN